MVLEIKKVETPADKNQFIQFPWEIYGDYPRWVPPLLAERKKFLDPKINPFFGNAEVDLYLALSADKRPRGRIALILDHSHNEFHSEKAGFFGMFESVNDQPTADLLLNTAYDWCRAKGLEKLVGPMNLSTNHECGLLVEGFDLPPMIGIPYNPPYYPDLFNRWGLVKARDLLSLRLDMIKIPEYMEQGMARIRKRGRFTVRCLRMDRFQEEIDIIWDIYNSAWSRNWGFVPMTRQEFTFAANEMKPVVQPEFCFIAEVKNEPAAFSLTLPDVNRALKPMNGKIFPFGWMKFYLNKKKINVYRVLTLGVKKKFRRLGIDVHFYYETYRRLLEKKVPFCEPSWILEDNQAILAPLYRMGCYMYKRHRIYERSCNN